MDAQLLVQIIVGLLGMIVGVIGWNVRDYKSDYQKLKDDHASHKLNVSENYAKKSDLNAARLETNESLKRVYDKIEAINQNFDKKISEVPDKIIMLLERAK